MKTLYLYPGQLASSDEPALLSTLLGSCVGVALHDPVRRAGGLNHFLLPRGSDGSTSSFRYGEHALEALLAALVHAGSRSRDVQAKIYGGNLVVEGLSGVDVGQRNTAFAREWLEARRIPVLEDRTGAERGCRITLRTDTFAVEYRLLAVADASSGEGGGTRAVSTGIPNAGAAHAGSAPRRRTRVLLVDDSATVRNVFHKVLDASGRIEVVGQARDPFEARELLVRERPDVMLLDIEMPRMTGVAFLEKVMIHMPTPVIMVSSLGSNDAAALRCLELGAVEFVHKPSQFDPLALRELADTLVAKVLAAAAEPIERLKARARRQTTGLASSTSVASPASSVPVAPRATGSHTSGTVELVLVGGNAGSPFAFQDFLAGLAADTPPVVAVVGPIAPLAAHFCAECKGNTAARLRVATNGMALSQGEVAIVPHGVHARLEAPAPGRYVLRLEVGGPVRGQIPSSGELFASAAALPSARGVVALLLSGFGVDGVDGLVTLRERGAHTIVVAPESAPFPRAPEEALRQGAADEVLPPAELAAAVLRHRSRLAS